MELDNLTCNRCGAPLKVPSHANYVTCNHCSTQLAVRRSEHAVFTEQLDKLAATTEQLSERVEDLSNLSELAALDRQWQMEQTGYMVTDNHGHRHLPSERTALGGGILITVFGLVWTAMAIGITSNAPSFGPFLVAKFAFPLFGIAFVVAGIIQSVSRFTKAGDFRRAERRYRRRRAELLGGDRDQRDRA